MMNDPPTPNAGSSVDSSPSNENPSLSLPDATVISNRLPIGEGEPPIPPRIASDPGVHLVGKSLGPFHLNRFIGGGGMGAVFEATDMELDRTVAVKVLTPRQHPDSARRFRTEAQSAARLNHDNIARVYQVGEFQGWDYIVFEFVAGENLRDVVERCGLLSLGQTLPILVQIAAALDHASDQGVVHRDIKPSNILLTADGRAKLVDMGLARLRIMESETDDHTESGVTLGTYDYISPEQGKDPRGVDVRSDLYSLGCTAFFMLSGQPPFSKGTPLQKLLRHAGEVPADIRILRPDLPVELALVIRKLLEKQPEQRYQRPRELYGDLRLIADRAGIVLHAPRLDSDFALPTGTVRSARLPWAIPLALFLAIAALLWLWDALQSEDVVPLATEIYHDAK